MFWACVPPFSALLGSSCADGGSKSGARPDLHSYLITILAGPGRWPRLRWVARNCNARWNFFDDAVALRFPWCLVVESTRCNVRDKNRVGSRSRWNWS